MAESEALESHDESERREWKSWLKAQHSGRGGQDGEHMQIHGWFISLYGKNPYNIVK